MQPIQILSVMELLPFPACQAATEPVGGINDSIPLHPDDHHPDFNELKRKKERKLPRGNPGGDAGNKHPDPGHQIDEYACPVQIAHEMIM